MNANNNFFKKIVFILPSICIGGAEKVVVDLLLEIKKQGLIGELVVLGNHSDNEFTLMLENEGVKITYCNVNGRVSITNYKKVSAVLKDIGPSFLNVHLDKRYSLLWSLLNRCKVAYTVHSAPYRINDSITKFFLKTLSKLGLLKVIAVSDAIAIQMTEVFRLPQSIVTSIINPVTFSKKRLDDVLSENIKFVSVARLTAIKNQKFLVDAFCKAHEKVKNIFLEIAGSGEEYDNLDKQIKDNKAERYIKLVGEVKDVEGFLEDKDVFLLTSISEALPVSILEAMAMGLPIISSNVGGISEIVTDNGILFESGDEEQFINSVLLLATDKEQRKKMACKSLNYATKYSIDKVLKKYLRVFGELIYV